MIKAVVFDLDDTLAPEIGFVKSGYRAVAQALSKDMGEIVSFLGGSSSFFSEKIEQRLWQLFEENHSNVFNRLLDFYEQSYDEADIKELVRIYREHMPYSDIYRCYDDVADTIKGLRECGTKLGVLSDGFLVSQKNKAVSLGLNDLFDEVLFTDMYGRQCWKPSSMGFLKLCESFRIKPNELLYVGDNPKKDFLVSKEIPIKTARIIRDGAVYAAAEYAEGVKETIRIDSLIELVDYVKEMA